MPTQRISEATNSPALRPASHCREAAASCWGGSSTASWTPLLWRDLQHEAGAHWPARLRHGRAAGHPAAPRLLWGRSVSVRQRGFRAHVYHGTPEYDAELFTDFWSELPPRCVSFILLRGNLFTAKCHTGTRLTAPVVRRERERSFSLAGATVRLSTREVAENCEEMEGWQAVGRARFRVRLPSSLRRAGTRLRTQHPDNSSLSRRRRRDRAGCHDGQVVPLDAWDG